MTRASPWLAAPLAVALALAGAALLGAWLSPDNVFALALLASFCE